MINNINGNMLLITTVVLFLLTAAIISVLGITANAIHLNRSQQFASEAFNIAESGGDKASLWLRDQSGPPSGTSAIDPFSGAKTLGAGTYTVTIYPDANNPTSYLKTYKIVSIGNVSGVTKKIESVVRQSSFGRYAYFTDKEASTSGGAIWWKAGELIDGPAHSNNTGGTNFNINYNNSNSPIFLDTLTAAGTTINYTPSRPKNDTTFKKIFKDGSKGFKLGVPPILLPPSSDAQKNAAWGSAGSFPSNNGVYLRPDSQGGIYIKGDAAIQLSIDGSGNQKLTVTQGSNVTNITVNKTSGTLTATGPLGTGSPSTTTSTTNGVVYCSDNITSLSGELANNSYSGSTILRKSAMTIATDVNAGKDITITNNLVYHTKPDKTKSSTDTVNMAAGTLGLVAESVTIASTAPANLEIDAVMLAGGNNTTSGSFGVANYSSKTPVGTLTVLGGIIQKERGAVGTFDSSSGVTKTGYAKNYHYDPRLGTDPPPFYPTTGQYERLSWKVLPNSN